MKLSIVVPCFNEEAVLDHLVDEFSSILPGLATHFEVLLVDDGSSDGTLAKMRQIAADRPEFRYVALSRNFGKEAAMLAGLSHVSGDAVAILDADLQHPPALLEQMLPYLDQGYDQVVARRTRDGDPLARTFASRAYYRVVNRMVEVKLEDGVGDFRLLSRQALRAVLSLGESNRFSKGLFAWIGFETATVDYTNVARAAGETKWRLRDLLNYGIDSIISFNSRPLRLAIHLGTLVSGVAFLYALWIVVRAMFQENPVPGYVTTICAVVGFGGLQMIFLGILGEYLGRIYLETKARPHFLVKETSEGRPTPVVAPIGREAEALIENVFGPDTPADPARR